jgi:hypothetical protein
VSAPLLLCAARYRTHTRRLRSPGFAVWWWWWRPKWPCEYRGVGPGRPAADRRPPDAARRPLALAVAAETLVLVSARAQLFITNF